MSRLSEHPTVKRHREKAVTRAAETSSLDATWLREVALAAGADDVGFVDVDRPEIAAEREDIRSLLPEARTLLSFVCRMNRENVRSPARSLANLEFHHTGDQVNDVARRIVSALERRGVRAVNPAMGFPMEMDRFPEKIWTVSHKPIAVAAGLGHMGHPPKRDPSGVRQLHPARHRTDRGRDLGAERAPRLQPLPGLQALRRRLPGRRDLRRRALRLLGLLHAQLPRVHGRLHELGGVDRRRVGRRSTTAHGSPTPNRRRCGRASRSAPTTRPPTACRSARPARR